jgi:hypothetical protein
MKYRIEYTGILNDKWLSGKIYTNRDEARAMVRYDILNTNHFDSTNRARFTSCRVVEHRP